MFCREKIAKLPPEVSEITKLEALTTAQQGRELLVQVNVLGVDLFCIIHGPYYILKYNGRAPN